MHAPKHSGPPSNERKQPLLAVIIPSDRLDRKLEPFRVKAISAREAAKWRRFPPRERLRRLHFVRPIQRPPVVRTRQCVRVELLMEARRGYQPISAASFPMLTMLALAEPVALTL